MTLYQQEMLRKLGRLDCAGRPGRSGRTADW